MDVAAEVIGIRADAHEAPRVRGQLVLLRRRRRAVRVLPTSAPSSRRASTSTCRSASCSWSSSAASAASWDRSSARRSSCCCRSSSTRSRRRSSTRSACNLPPGLMSNLELMVFGGADHLLPDRRAARARAAVADRQGEAAAVAVPALMVQRNRMRRRVAVVAQSAIDTGSPRQCCRVDFDVEAFFPRRRTMKAIKSALLGACAARRRGHRAARRTSSSSR